jgi:hypothetical protein
MHADETNVVIMSAARKRGVRAAAVRSANPGMRRRLSMTFCFNLRVSAFIRGSNFFSVCFLCASASLCSH